jgi:hypothetical protein
MLTILGGKERELVALIPQSTARAGTLTRFP